MAAGNETNGFRISNLLKRVLGDANRNDNKQSAHKIIPTVQEEPSKKYGCITVHPTKHEYELPERIRKILEEGRKKSIKESLNKDLVRTGSVNIW